MMNGAMVNIVVVLLSVICLVEANDGYQSSKEEFEFEEKLTEYGKNGIRVMRMRQEGDVYYIKEAVVDVRMKLSTHDEYKRGNNSNVFATDTMLNRVYALAKMKGIDTIEKFALDICQNHLDAYKQVVNCIVYIEEMAWRRMDNLGAEHNHAFISSREATRFAEVLHKRHDQAKLYSGIKDMQILKTTQSGFAGFLKDEYTSLLDSYDRIFSTVASVKWLYIDTAEDYDHIWECVNDVTLAVFAGPPETGEFSECIQRTAYKTAEKILQDFSEIQRAEIEMPNVNYFSANLGKIGIENNNEVFAPADDPHAIKRVALKRK